MGFDAPRFGAQRGATWILAAVAAARAISWTPLAGATTAALAGAATQRWLTPAARAPVTLLALAVLAAGVACVVDDDAATTLVGSPTGLRVRLLIRIACGISAGVASWSAVVATIRLASGAAPPGEFTLLWCGLTAASLSLAAASTRLLPDTPAGLVASVTLLLGVLLFVLTPPAPALARLAGAVPWDHPAERLTWTITASASVIVWSTRDPARRTRPAASAHRGD